MASQGRQPSAAAAGLLLVAVACCGLDGRAAASAWNRPAGEGLAIVDFGSEAGDAYYDARGRLGPARAYEKRAAAAYVEYGATDRLMLVARPALEWASVGPPDPGRRRGFDGAAFGAQWQAMVFGPAVLAAQASARLPGAASRPDPARGGSAPREAELRALGGVSLPSPLRPFLDIQAGYRIRSGGLAAQWHVDATAGLYPTDRLLVLAQSFTTVPDGRAGAQRPGGRITRLDAKIVYALSRAWAVQLGLFETVLGRESLKERGFTAGVWYTF